MTWNLKNILHIKCDTPYYLFGDDNYTIILEKFLTHLKRNHRYAGRLCRDGFVNKNTNGYFIVVSGPSWASDVDFLVNNDVKHESIILSVLPVQDGWGWYDFLPDIMKYIEVEDDGTCKLISAAVIIKLTSVMTIIHKKENQLFFNLAYYYSGHAKRIPDSYGYRELIESVSSKLSDEKSRTLYKNMFWWEPMGVIQYFSENVFRSIQYMDYITLGSGDVILNGGIATGCEIPIFASMVGMTGKIICVDPYGFEFLSDYVKPTVDYFKTSISEHRVALMDYVGEVNIGDNCVPCTTIDGLVEEIGLDRLDLIKLDLEGAEFKLLEGILNLCNKFRTQVAISIYHAIAHYWEIPKYFMDRLVGYSFYVEQYSPCRFDTILYMIPNGRAYIHHPKKVPANPELV